MAAEISLSPSLFDLVENVAGADSIDDLQSRYLDGVGRFLASSAAGLYVLNPFTGGAEAIAARGVSDFFLSRYEEVGRHRDPVLECALTTLGGVHNRQLMEVEEWKELPVYGEVFGLHRMTELLEAPLTVAGEVVGTLNFGRTQAEGPFTESERIMAEAVAALLGVALASVRRRRGLERERDAVVAALELCSDALLVTDLRSAERRINAAGRRLLDRLAADQPSLDDLMVAPGTPGRSDRRCASVTLRDGTPGVLCVRSVTPGEDPATTVTFLTLTTEGPQESLAIADLGLTRREHQVAELAVTGLRDNEIADRLSLSRHTVKQYLKAVYGKAGVRSRVELTSVAHRGRVAPD